MSTSLFKRIFGIWLLLLLAMNAVNWNDGGVNPASRFAAIQAMSEDHSFRIDHYKDWTYDWAKGPSGGIYSNKAPGPMFLATPVAWVLNRIKIAVYGKDAWFTYPDGITKLSKPGLGYVTLISWLFQLLPYCFVTLLALSWLWKKGMSYGALNFACLAILFGNTCSIYLNMYFGHAVAGWALLAALLCLFQRREVGAGFLFGLAVLSDYGTVFVLIPFLFATLMMMEVPMGENLEKRTRRGSFRSLGRIALGGLFPAAVFAWYHTVCFGKPWALPMQFQNPMFVEADVVRPRIWGVAAPIPDWRILLQLCFGGERGLLFTQPWVLVSFVIAVRALCRQKLSRELYAGLFLAFGGLLGLLWMNGGFNGWHGGSAAGPRYLSIIFPCVGLMSGMLIDQLTRVFGSGSAIFWRRALWVTLAYSIVFRVMIYCTNPTPDHGFPIWTYAIDYFFRERHLPVRVVTLVLVSGAFIWAGTFVWKQRAQSTTA